MYRSLRWIVLAALMLAGSEMHAQQYAYIVRFADKNNTPFSLSSPTAYLSPRAITRRSNQGIAVDSTDLPVNRTYIDTVLNLTGTGTKLHSTSRWLNFCVVLLRDSANIHAIEDKPWVAGTEFIAWYSDSLHRPSDDAGTATGGLNFGNKKTWASAEYGNTWIQTALVNGNKLHDDNYTGNGKLIAVIDAGFIDVNTHPGFTSMLTDGRLIDTYNFTLDEDGVFGWDVHGMRALATIAGYVPGTYIGSAPMASFALYISEDNNSEQPIELANMLAATERADSVGADVITTSLGYNLFDNPADNFVFAADFDGISTIAAKAANIATSKGILFVATAGNEGGGGWNMVLTPGDADSALTIGSVDFTGVSAPNSGYGPNAAGRVKPDVCGMGQLAAIFNGSGYGNQSGTSFSTPQIAGWAACLWQAYPTATPFQIKEAIIRCASRYTSPTAQQGYGIPDFWCAVNMILSIGDDLEPFTTASWVTATPNPSHDIVNIIVAPDEDNNVSFQIMDMAGRVLISQVKHLRKGYNDAVTISLSHLPSGIYTLNVVAGSQHQVQKLVKF